jgi:pimeloyl-ACP methyl ester carboxylesterase
MVNKRNISFPSDNLKLRGELVYPADRPLSPGVLILHGGGFHGQNNFSAWQEYLAENGIASFFFFFRGCGQSQGKFSEGTLFNRLKDAQAAYQTFQNSCIINPKCIGLLASSMGGHIAARMTETLPDIKALIMYGAAAYGESAEHLPLNRQFTIQIRKPNSWEKSPAFAALAGFPNPVLLIYGQNDRVIPEGVKAGYNRALSQKGVSIIIPKSDHFILNGTTAGGDNRQKIFTASLAFLRFGLR